MCVLFQIFMFRNFKSLEIFGKASAKLGTSKYIMNLQSSSFIKCTNFGKSSGQIALIVTKCLFTHVTSSL